MTIKNILAIETSCDETAVSILSHDTLNHRICIQAHVVESQNESHAPFGGVVPEIAARDHLAKIDPLTREALKNSFLQKEDIHSIAVTLGPGLIGALMVGVLYARGLALARNLPLIGVNHVRAHLAPCFFLPSDFSLKNDIQKWFSIRKPEFPILALTVSGGHCHLSLLQSENEHIILGRTLDDACGEAFDKVAKLLGLGYPGGGALEKLAQTAQTEENGSHEFLFSQPFQNRDASIKNRFNFSYSGLKTSVFNTIKKAELPKDAPRIAAGFQHAALLQLKTRVTHALVDFGKIRTLFVAGGVAQNKTFRALFADLPVNLVFAPPDLCSDNATMIGLQSILDARMNALTLHPFSGYPYENEKK